MKIVSSLALHVFLAGFRNGRYVHDLFIEWNCFQLVREKSDLSDLSEIQVVSFYFTFILLGLVKIH